MSKLIYLNNTKTFYKFDKKWWAILLKKCTIRDWWICIFSFRILCSAFFSHTFFYSLKLITNRALEFSQSLLYKNQAWSIGLKLHIETTYIFTGDRIRKSLSSPDQIKKVLTLNLAVKYYTGLLSHYSDFQTPQLNLGIF